MKCRLLIAHLRGMGESECQMLDGYPDVLEKRADALCFF
jgi:hypothetical protein